MKMFYGIILLLIVLASCTATSNGIKATVYKSPSCGCCSLYARELKTQGYDVNVVEVSDMSPIKNKYSIPSSMQTCHTTVIGDYYVEGHVPFAAVEKLLTEKPTIDGIALPGMPVGSPGMPGSKQGKFTIYAIKGSEKTAFMEI